MSQVGIPSRPATQMGAGSRAGPQLPQIEHPLSRLGNPDNMDVRGMSRADHRLGTMSLGRPATQGRPMASENSQVPPPRKLYTSSGRQQTGQSRRKTAASRSYEGIPEGVEVTMGDPSTTRLPLFGSRADVASRAGLESRATSRLSKASSQNRLEIDELEMVLKEKVKHNFFEVRKRFKDNDPEQKGNATREALARIVVTTVNRPISQFQFSRLMDRMGLRDKQVVSFNEFYACFRDNANTEYPKWMDPVNRPNSDLVTLSAHQVHSHLKEKAKQKFFNLADLIPQLNPDGARKIMQGEFRNMLNKMSFYMEEEEFQKLWSRYDKNNTGLLDAVKLMNALGISMRKEGATSAGRMSPIEEKSGHTPKKRKEEERKRSLDIERWLKNKFREGFKNMRAEFESLDKGNAGMVSSDDFLATLRKFGLSLEKSHLPDFVSRCGLEAGPDGISYKNFLAKFQDRSDKGLTHSILTNAKHRYNADKPVTAGGQSGISRVEAGLMNLFQRDFLALLGTFHKIDRHDTDLITQEEFRAAIESRFGVEMNEEQFSALVDRVPLDRDGMVKYAQFMALFDTKGDSKSLFAGRNDEMIKPLTPPESEINRLIVSHEEMELEDQAPKRMPQELFKIIKELLTRRYHDVEKIFLSLDETNTKRLTQEMMFQMLRQSDIQPEVSRGEIRDLWKTFIVNSKNSLNWDEFVRHFGFNMKSAAYPNAKLAPPKRGDADYMIRSRKLNCASDMLQDSLRSKIDYKWEDLRREFVAMDPYSTGFVTREEFRDILTELCVQLSDYELEMLTKKFEISGDGRVSYIEFLKPFALKKQTWRHGNNMLSMLQHPQSNLPLSDTVDPPQKGLNGVSAKIRQSLAGDWKSLRRAFKKLDIKNDGYLSFPEFRSVLKLCNVLLDEEEVYQVLNEFDDKMTGQIPYNKFLQDTLNIPPSTQASMKSRKSSK